MKVCKNGIETALSPLRHPSPPNKESKGDARNQWKELEGCPKCLFPALCSGLPGAGKCVMKGTREMCRMSYASRSSSIPSLSGASAPFETPKSPPNTPERSALPRSTPSPRRRRREADARACALWLSINRSQAAATRQSRAAGTAGHGGRAPPVARQHPLQHAHER